MISERFDVHWVDLDPAVGAEMQKRRPCVIVSPDEIHQIVRTVIIAPMTTTVRSYPMRPVVTFRGQRSQIALDQMRAVDRSRLGRRIAKLDPDARTSIARTLVAMFALGPDE